MSDPINQATIQLIKRNEGCCLKAYQDSVGVWTIGYGHTGSVKAGRVVTQHQADEILKYDLEKYSEGVDELTAGLGLSDNQFAACVSLTFNVGVTRFASSTLLK